MDVKKGDRFLWQESVHIEVTRVSTGNLWADIKCWVAWTPERTWSRRMELPFPETYVPWKE
jgi:hypothetical protein